MATIGAQVQDDSLLGLVKSHPEGLSEYDLLTQLFAGLPDAERPNLSDSLVLFQQHFCLFHRLYALNDRLLATDEGCLRISALCIQWLPASEASNQALAEADPLRDYYLDASNLEGTDRAAVESLLDDFWARFVDTAERDAALALLDLQHPVSYPEIKRRYRQRVSACHPDKGGDHQQTLALNDAFAVLKQCYR